MFTHSLDPMQSQCVQHSTRTLHHHQNGNGKEEPESECDDDDRNTNRTGHVETVLESHVPEDDGELLMGKRQSPET